MSSAGQQKGCSELNPATSLRQAETQMSSVQLTRMALHFKVFSFLTAIHFAEITGRLSQLRTIFFSWTEFILSSKEDQMTNNPPV